MQNQPWELNSIRGPGVLRWAGRHRRWPSRVFTKERADDATARRPCHYEFSINVSRPALGGVARRWRARARPFA